MPEYIIPSIWKFVRSPNAMSDLERKPYRAFALMFDVILYLKNQTLLDSDPISCTVPFSVINEIAIKGGLSRCPEETIDLVDFLGSSEGGYYLSFVGLFERGCIYKISDEAIKSVDKHIKEATDKYKRQVVNLWIGIAGLTIVTFVILVGVRLILSK